MLQTVFSQLVGKYIINPDISILLWLELEKHYTAENRHYHTLQHLQNMYEQLQEVKSEIKDWDTVLFSLFYHDIIYSATAKDNEEKSADIAEKALQLLNYPAEKIALCKAHILATKNHVMSPDLDTNYFTDADLSILGTEWPVYEAYTKAIRKEYSIYPDLLYKPGRRKVLQHFLGMEKIYKTIFFQSKYEVAAKVNLQKELQLLQ